ncbi:MAG: cupin [Gemmatimonas sp.]|nr:cupin [Gemmatimonas sp.]
MSKPELEFYPAVDVAWRNVSGSDGQLKERILSADDETGVATRILFFSRGADTTPLGVQVHDFWEEVYILSGEMVDLTLDQAFTAGMYACRPPGMRHGPWRSPNGCTTFEVRYQMAPPSCSEAPRREIG